MVYPTPTPVPLYKMKLCKAREIPETPSSQVVLQGEIEARQYCPGQDVHVWRAELEERQLLPHSQAANVGEEQDRHCFRVGPVPPTAPIVNQTDFEGAMICAAPPYPLIRLCYRRPMLRQLVAQRGATASRLHRVSEAHARAIPVRYRTFREGAPARREPPMGL